MFIGSEAPCSRGQLVSLPSESTTEPWQAYQRLAIGDLPGVDWCHVIVNVAISSDTSAPFKEAFMCYSSVLGLSGVLCVCSLLCWIALSSVGAHRVE
jgi:hypothetical protein